jgi:putative membrane protein
MQKTLAFLAVLSLSLAACSSNSKKNAEAPAPNTQTTTLTTTQSLTDAQIAEVMATANRGEIQAAEIAKKNAKDKAVKDFANMMITEHRKNDREGKQIAQKAGIKPAKNELATTLETDVKTKTTALKKLKGTAFDSAYISQQVAIHEGLLQELDSKLIPSAQNAEMKAFLEKTKTHVQTHLDRAREILASQPQAQ